MTPATPSAAALLRELAARRPPAALARRARLLALRDEALECVRDEALLAPRAAGRVWPLDAAPAADGVFTAGGERLAAPRLLPAGGRLTGLACAVATIGDALERRCAALFAERRAALAVALDGVGNELLFALSRRVQDGLAATLRRQGLTLAGELRAGDPGLELEAQRAVLRLAGAEAIGLRLSTTLMMSPAKSTSFVQAVGEDLPATAASRCDDCRSRARCTLAAPRD